MKPNLCSFLAVLLTSGVVHGGSVAYTTPVGFTTQKLVLGQNLIGITLHKPVVASGDFDVVSGSVLTDNQVTYAPLTARTYILEIVSAANPALVGTIQEVPGTSISGHTITTPDNLGSLGLAAGDRYNLRLAPTLEDIFTTKALSQGGVLSAGGTGFGNADIIWIPKAAGTFERYFLKTGTNAGFKKITGPLGTDFVNAPNVPVIYADGLVVNKRYTTAASLTVSGEVKKVGTNSVLTQGKNLIGQVSPVGLTLRNAGLEDDITAASTVANADIVWLQNPATLVYTKYMRSTASGGTWCLATGTYGVALDPSVDPPILGSFYIERKSSTPVTLDLNVPPSYGSL